MLILNIQHWHADREQAMELLRLMADIEPKKREDVTVLVSARFDCHHDEDAIRYASEKFNIKKFKNSIHATGWPAGPNAMLAESYKHCIELVESGQVQAKAVMFIEADCVPLHAQWIDKLKEEYTACGKDVLGHWITAEEGGGWQHVNGNLIMAIDFYKKVPEMLVPAPDAWDAIYSVKILPFAHPSKLIYSDYHLGGDRNPWKGCDRLWEPKSPWHPENPLHGQSLNPVWLHGPKTLDGIKCVRERLSIAGGTTAIANYKYTNVRSGRVCKRGH